MVMVMMVVMMVVVMVLPYPCPKGLISRLSVWTRHRRRKQNQGFGG